MNLWFWVWIGLVVVFTVAEIIEGGGFIGPWALGAAAAALLELFSAPIDWQWVAFIGLSSVTFVAWRRLFHPPQGLPSPEAPTAAEKDSA